MARTLPPLVAELRPGDEVIVVDNASDDGTVAAVREAAPGATVVEAGVNLGYGAGCNRGAAAGRGDLLLFLNPDAEVAPGFREAIERPLADGRGWAAWQGLVTADGGRVINTSGGVVHFTGIAWAGGAGQPLAALYEKTTPSVANTYNAGGEEPGFVSGACLAIPRERFEEIGGFAEDFFLYHEDVDLSLRLRLAGGRLGVEPSARADHDYEFAKGPTKWRQLERNRWATIVRTYPGSVLAGMVPALIATELALVPIAIAGGWLPQKVGAWWDSARALPRLRRERRVIQRTRTVSAADFARPLVADLDSAYLGAAGRSRPLRSLLRGYRRLLLALLGG